MIQRNIYIYKELLIQKLYAFVYFKTENIVFVKK